MMEAYKVVIHTPAEHRAVSKNDGRLVAIRVDLMNEDARGGKGKASVRRAR